MHVPIHGAHIRSIVALMKVLRLLRLVLRALVCLRELMRVVPLVDGAAHGVLAVGILRPRGAGLGQVPVHLMESSLRRRLLAVEGRPRRHGASKGHSSERMRGV